MRNVKKLAGLRYDLIPYQELTEAYARVAEHGAEKYDPWNWTKGLSRRQIMESLLRHSFAYNRGEDIDDGPGGSGLNHADHIFMECSRTCTSHSLGVRRWQKKRTGKSLQKK